MTPRTDEVPTPPDIGPLLAETLWQKAVGVYYSVGAEFVGISEQRYNDVIRPEIERLAAEVERLKVFEDYADHHGTCRTVWAGERVCTCGFAEIAT